MGKDFLVEVNIKAAGFWTVKKIREIVQLVACSSGVKEGVVEVNLVSPAEIKKINRRSRGKNEVTDVLSFAWQEDHAVRTKHWGEIFLCLERIQEQARRFEIKEEEELARLLAHGFLHLLGYDHGKPADAKKMFARQEAIVKKYFSR